MKSAKLLGVALAASLLFNNTIYAQDSDEAQKLTPVFADEGAHSKITDASYYTSESFTQGTSLDISLEKECNAVYIEWQTTPEKVEITYGNEGFSGVPEFYHQLIKSNRGFTDFSIAFSGDSEICDIYFFSEGTLPKWVQDWKSPCEKADILLLSTHADDEYLMFGGTIPYYACELGLDFQVAYFTTHYEEQPRPHELLDGLWASGVTHFPVFSPVNDYPVWTLKQALDTYDEEHLLNWTVELLRRFKPSVAITHDINGEYGHGMHMLAAKTMMNAVNLSGDYKVYPSSAQKYGAWSVPKTYLHFWEENAVEFDWEITLESFGGITAREAAELGYSYHKSQHIYGYSVNYGKYWDCRQFGLYRADGCDFDLSAADFMEGLTPNAELLEAREAEEKETLKVMQELREEKAEQTTTVKTEPVSDATEQTIDAQQEKASENSVVPIVIGGVIFLGAALLMTIYTVNYNKKFKRKGKRDRK